MPEQLPGAEEPVRTLTETTPSENESASEQSPDREPRIWLAAARTQNVDWQERLEVGKSFEWTRIRGSRAKDNLEVALPSDLVLLFQRGTSEQALVGMAEIVEIGLKSPSTRLLPRIRFQPLYRETLERAVPDLSCLKNRGAFTEVTPEQWAVIREILRQRKPGLDSDLPRSTVEARAAADVTNLSAPASVKPGASLPNVELVVRNTGNVTWHSGETVRFRGSFIPAGQKLPDAVPKFSGDHTVTEDVPPGSDLQAQLDVPQLPDEKGKYKIQVVLLADESRWGPQYRLGQVEHSITVGASRRKQRPRKRSAPRKDVQKKAPDEKWSKTTAATKDARETESLSETEEPSTAAAASEAAGSTAPPRPDESIEAEPEHVPGERFSEPPEPEPPAPGPPITREVRIIQQLYQPPPRERKLTLRISGDASVLHFGRDEYKSPLRLDPPKLLVLEAEPVAYGRALFDMVIHEERLPGLPNLPTRYGYRKALEETGGELRIELAIDSPSPELLGLAWERLHDGSERPPLAASERTPFYRRVGIREPRLSEPPLEVLVAISSPRALGTGENALLRDLAPLEVAEEAEAIDGALRPLRDAGLAEYQILGDEPGRPLRFEQLSDALQNKVQVLHLLAHGLYDREKDYCLAIEREDGGQPLVPAANFAQALLATQQELRLVVLQACRSGQVAQAGGTGAALATILVQNGLPAVIGMRENLGLRTARYFNQRFYTHLARSEHVEMALAATRFNLYQRKIDGEGSWSVPVLHLGVETGRLFGVDPVRAPRLEDVEPPLPAEERTDGADAVAAGVAEAVRAADAGGPLTEEGIRRISEAAVRAAASSEPLARPQNRSELSNRMRSLVRLRGDDLGDFVQEKTGLDVPRVIYHQAASALNAGKHVVLIGPPGTGKTSLAHAIAEYAAGKSFSTGTVPTTASADWTTFDTVGGYVPVSAERLAFRPGLFLRAIASGQWLVLDEINRAEIDKAVGELFTVLSGQRVDLPYRVEGQGVKILPARKEPHPANWVPAEATGDYDYVVHPNWRILATMNVYDKSSLFAMSFAFMRRFAFVDVGVPDEATIFAGLRHRWIEDNKKAVAEAHGGDDGKAAEVLDPLRRKLDQVFAGGAGTLMSRRELGPAIAQDMIRYVFDRFSHSPNADLVDLAREAFLLYAVPQLDGLDRQAVLEVYGYVARIFYDEDQGRPAGPREVLDRIRALYPHVPGTDWAGALRTEPHAGD